MPVGEYFQPNHLGLGALADHGVVQAQGLRHPFSLPVNKGLEKQARIRNKFTLEKLVQGCVGLFQGDFGQKTQPSEIDTDNRDVLAAHEPGHGEQRAVSPQDDDGVCQGGDLRFSVHLGRPLAFLHGLRGVRINEDLFVLFLQPGNQLA